jgi:O-antigen/teichoic acid export membrane protein
MAADVGAPADRRSSLTVASGLLGLSTIATRLTTLVVMALLARGAGTEAVGYFGLATLIASFVAAAVSLGLPTYLTREASAGLVPPAEVARIHWVRLAVLLLVAGLAFPVAGGFLSPEIRLAFALFFVASLLEQGNETAWVLIRGTRTAWAEPLTNTSVGLVLVAACAVDAWLLGGLSLARAAGYVAAAAALRSLAAFAVVGIRRHLRTPAEVHSRRHVRGALPYFASDLLGLLYFRGDVVILALFVSAGEVGEYVAAAAIIGPAVQVAASMGVGALAYAARRLTGGDPGESPPVVVRFFTASGQVAAGLMALGLPVAVALLFGGAGERILSLAMVLTLFLALRFTNFGLSSILLARGRADRRLIVLAVSIAGNVALNVALDGRYGAFGAAWATVATEIIVAGSLLWSLRDAALVRPVAWAFAATAVAGSVALVTTEAVGGAVLLIAAAVTLLIQRRATARGPASPGLRSVGSAATGATKEGGATQALGPARAERAPSNSERAQ